MLAHLTLVFVPPDHEIDPLRNHGLVDAVLLPPAQVAILFFTVEIFDESTHQCSSGRAMLNVVHSDINWSINSRCIHVDIPLIRRRYHAT